LAGRTQRTEHLYMKTLRAFKQPGLVQAVYKTQRGNHRTDGVRTRRPDTHLENIKYAQGHFFLDYVSSPPDLVQRLIWFSAYWDRYSSSTFFSASRLFNSASLGSAMSLNNGLSQFPVT